MVSRFILLIPIVSMHYIHVAIVLLQCSLLDAMLKYPTKAHYEESDHPSQIWFGPKRSV
jgi:hypothetical protein